MADKRKVETSHLVIGAAVLIIILIAGWMAFSRTRVDSSIVNGSENNSSETENTKAEGIVLVVEDQAAGQRVMVKAMELPDGGWIAIKESDSNRVLGAARFPAGATSGDVALLRATTAGEDYEAVVYEDDGDGAFDMRKDVMVDGVSAAFTAQ